MTSQFDLNIVSLGKNNNHIISEINGESLQYQFVARDGEEEFFISKDQKVYILKDEEDQANTPNKLRRELFFILGINSAKEIKAIIRNANNRAFFVIIEPEISFFHHALQTKKLDFLANPNVMLIVQPIEALPEILENTFRNTPMLNLVKNIRFYNTYFYRNFATDVSSKVLKEITTSVKTFLFAIGNSLEDSLQGFTQNLANLKFLQSSKDVSRLKNIFKGIPAIIVSAGPSLDKNLHYLKEANGKAVIIAVDTILQKVLDNGIIPDFVCSVERNDVVYNYFYKDKNIPKQTTLVVPHLVYPDIIENYPGEYILPLRTNVYEYMWLGSLLDLGSEYFIPMGSSCAHLAFGFANHLGLSPIILTGQDLAYGEGSGKSHSSGTIYDSGNFVEVTHKESFEVEGYYGKSVLTSPIWNAFRRWFEVEISNASVKVINATEGGAKINHTIQMRLKDALNENCKEEVNVLKIIKECPFIPVDMGEIKNRISNEIALLKIYSSKVEDIKRDLIKIKENLSPNMSSKKLMESLELMKKTDEIIPMVSNHKLLYHLLLPELSVQIREMLAIDEVLSYETVKRNLDIQTHLINAIEFVLNKITELMDDYLVQGN